MQPALQLVAQSALQDDAPQPPKQPVHASPHPEHVHPPYTSIVSGDTFFAIVTAAVIADVSFIRDFSLLCLSAPPPIIFHSLPCPSLYLISYLADTIRPPLHPVPHVSVQVL